MSTRILLICDKCGYEDRFIPGEDPEDYDWAVVDDENWCRGCCETLVEVEEDRVLSQDAVKRLNRRINP